MEEEEEEEGAETETFHRFQGDSLGEGPPPPGVLITLPEKTFTYG